MVPGEGLSPLLFSNSSAISCPCMGFFEMRKRIKNERKPRMSQQSLLGGQSSWFCFFPLVETIHIGRPIPLNSCMKTNIVYPIYG